MARAARTEIERTVQPSLLDRLTDLEPQRTLDPPTSYEASAEAFRASVQRDLQWLLNTRRSIVPVPPDCPEVRASVHEFGLPDTTGIPIGTAEGREMLLTAMRDTLARFEPRLADVRITLGELQQMSMPQLRFVVEAMLRMDPDLERVVFDTRLEVARGEYEVREEGAA